MYLMKPKVQSVRRVLKTSFIATLKVMLLLKSARAEEESILDLAIVTSECSPDLCVDE